MVIAMDFENTMSVLNDLRGYQRLWDGIVI